MVSFLRTLSAKPSVPFAIAAATATATVLSSSNRPPGTVTTTRNPHKRFSFPPSSRLLCLSAARNLAPPQSSTIHMDTLAAEVRTEEERSEMLPVLLTEFMVDMKCEGCVSAVKEKLQNLNGVEQVDVDLGNQVVRVWASLPFKTMLNALEQTGRNARLIGQGSPEDFLISAAVAEFKGPAIYGVVHFAQVNMELARIEASFSGLSAGKHALSINEFGDLTEGPASTGKVFNPPLGDLGTLEAQEKGEVQFSGAKQMLKVADLIGRSIVVYETEDKSDPGIAAAVIARSAGVGENYKKLCTCDGVTIWESN